MDRRIKTAIWGLGRAAFLQHVPELERFSDYFELAGSYDIIPERMHELASRTGAKCYDSPEAMLDDPGIELVSVVTRHADHVPHGIRVLDAGKCVFLEKPLALSYEQVLELRAVSDRHPGKLFCRQNRRFLAEFMAIREIIDSGVLGDISEVRLSEEWYKRRVDWQTLTSAGGGLLNNWAPHLTDQALQLMGAPVSTVWADLRHLTSMGDAEDCFRIIFRGTNNRIIEIASSEGAALPAPYGVVYGNKGMLVTAANRSEITVRHVDQEKTGAAQAASAETPATDLPYSDHALVWHDEVIKVDRGTCDWHDSYRFLYDAIRGIKEFPVKNEEAFEVVRLTDLARRSNGQTISAL